MTKEMLMKLYAKNKEGKIGIDQIFDMKYLSDEEIEFIMSTSNIDVAVDLCSCYALCKGSYFSSRDKEFKMQIIDLISKGKKQFNKSIGINVALSLMDNGFQDETVFLVLEIISEIKNSTVALCIKTITDYVEKFNNISKLSDDSYVVSDELLLKIINRILNTDKEYLVKYGTEVFKVSFDKFKDDILKYLDLLYSCKHDYQAKAFFDVISSEKYENKEQLFKVLEIVSSSLGKMQANMASDVALCSIEEVKNNVLEFVSILANAKGDKQAMYAKEIIDDIKVLGLQDTMTLSKTMANLSVNRVAVSKIAKDIFAGYADKKNQVSFWDEFLSDPKGAIELLGEEIDRDSEIPYDLKIKKKVYDKK